MVGVELGEAVAAAEGLLRAALGPPEDEPDPHENVRTATVNQTAPRRISVETLSRTS